MNRQEISYTPLLINQHYYYARVQQKVLKIGKGTLLQITSKEA